MVCVLVVRVSAAVNVVTVVLSTSDRRGITV